MNALCRSIRDQGHFYLWSFMPCTFVEGKYDGRTKTRDDGGRGCQKVSKTA